MKYGVKDLTTLGTFGLTTFQAISYSAVEQALDEHSFDWVIENFGTIVDTAKTDAYVGGCMALASFVGMMAISRLGAKDLTGCCTSEGMRGTLALMFGTFGTAFLTNQFAKACYYYTGTMVGGSSALAVAGPVVLGLIFHLITSGVFGAIPLLRSPIADGDKRTAASQGAALAFSALASFIVKDNLPVDLDAARKAVAMASASGFAGGVGGTLYAFAAQKIYPFIPKLACCGPAGQQEELEAMLGEAENIQYTAMEEGRSGWCFK